MRTIVLIEDDLQFGEIISFALEDKGYTVIQAEDGQEGIALVEEHAPDLVLCDVQMTGMDGYETLGHLRSQDTTAAIPFILMTGAAGPEGIRTGMNLGADDYLSKPFAVSELLQAVEVRLAKHNTIREEAEREVEALRESITITLPHELRTPLNGIIGSAQLLSEDAATMGPDEVQEFAEMILTSGQRLNRLVENFLIHAQLELVARDEAKTAALRRSRCAAPAPCITTEVQLCAAQHTRADDVTTALADAPVAADEEHLQRMVGELIDNACKFSESGSPVTVTAVVADDEYMLTVVDQGRGISQNRLKAIGAYQQFDRALHEQQGIGLGLQIVHRLAKLLGGAFMLESTKGEGTRASVTLPLASANTSPSSPSYPSAYPSA
ncbi:MAG: response regulator [Bacteroidetes bacterium]|jgi:signal transduction histidine kinase|nr:response regulator [Bacteroidota bacterium]